MKNWPVETTPLPIDILKWSPLDKYIVRKKLNLPQKSKLIIFGAIGGTNDPRKGFELLRLALKNLKNISSSDNLDLIIFGGGDKNIHSEIDFKTHHFGEINNDKDLQELYCAADVMVAPSKLETLGQTAIEALACGTPVVAFKGTGLSDIVEHKKTGYLAEALNEKDLAEGINWVLENSSDNTLSIASRNRAENFFSEKEIIKKYRNIYNNLLLDN
jgi:glycosyltransferase involved in cell wall biosynthesis